MKKNTKVIVNLNELIDFIIEALNKNHLYQSPDENSTTVISWSAKPKNNIIKLDFSEQDISKTEIKTTDINYLCKTLNLEIFEPQHIGSIQTHQKQKENK